MARSLPPYASATNPKTNRETSKLGAKVHIHGTQINTREYKDADSLSRGAIATFGI